jgi:hypothetical protein
MEAGIPTIALPVATEFNDEDDLIGNQGASTKRFPKALIGGGGGAGSSLVVQAESNSPRYTFDGVDYNAWASATVLQTAADAEWDNTLKKIIAHAIGVYKITITGRIDANGTTWPTGTDGDWTLYGTTVPQSPANFNRSAHFRETAGTFGDSNEDFVQWSDEYLVAVTVADTDIFPAIYGKKYSGGSLLGKFFAMITCTRV